MTYLVDPAQAGGGRITVNQPGNTRSLKNTPLKSICLSSTLCGSMLGAERGGHFGCTGMRSRKGFWVSIKLNLKGSPDALYNHLHFPTIWMCPPEANMNEEAISSGFCLYMH